MKWKWKWSRVRLFVTPWTVTHQAPQPMEFSKQEYWSGLPPPALQADALPSEPPGKPNGSWMAYFHPGNWPKFIKRVYKNIGGIMWNLTEGEGAQRNLVLRVKSEGTHQSAKVTLSQEGAAL